MPVAAANGVIFLYSFPTGQAGSYIPKLADTQIVPVGSGGTVVDASGASVAVPSAALDADGYLTYGEAFRLFQVVSVPAKTTATRLYRYIARTPAAADDLDQGLTLNFNRQDAGNKWQLRLNWEFGLWELQLDEMIGGVPTSRLDPNLPTAVDEPAIIILSLYDIGDRLTVEMRGYETDALVDIGSVTATYTAIDRPLKNETTFEYGSHGVGDFSLRSMSVIDL
jgi:hypothetical protein